MKARLACLLLALAGCNRPSEPSPTTDLSMADATARAPDGHAGGDPTSQSPITVRGVGKDAKARPKPKTGRLGPSGPTKARTTSPKIYLRNLEARRRGLDDRLRRKPDETPTLANLAAWHIEKAQLDGDLGHALDAEKLLSKAISIKDSVPLRMQRARVHAHMHRFAEARADLEAAVAAAPTDGSATHALAWTLHQLGDRMAARKLLAVPPHLGPRSYGEYAREATLLFEQGRVEEADQRLRLAAGAYHDVQPIPMAWIDLQRGLLRLRTGRNEDAREFFRAAYARLPQFFVAAEHLAETEALLGNHAAALALYDEVIDNTRLAEFIAARARVLRDMGRAEDAATAIRAADARWRKLVAKFGAAMAAHAVSFWLEDLPRPADAHRWAELNLRGRRDPMSLVLAARARAATKDYEGARALLADAEQATLRVDEFYADMADAWHRLGEAEKAAEYLAKARELNPKTPGIE